MEVLESDDSDIYFEIIEENGEKEIDVPLGISLGYETDTHKWSSVSPPYRHLGCELDFESDSYYVDWTALELSDSAIRSLFDNGKEIILDFPLFDKNKGGFKHRDMRVHYEFVYDTYSNRHIRLSSEAMSYVTMVPDYISYGRYVMKGDTRVYNPESSNSRPILLKEKWDFRKGDYVTKYDMNFRSHIDGNVLKVSFVQEFDGQEYYTPLTFPLEEIQSMYELYPKTMIHGVSNKSRSWLISLLKERNYTTRERNLLISHLVDLINRHQIVPNQSHTDKNSVLSSYRSAYKNYKGMNDQLDCIQDRITGHHFLFDLYNLLFKGKSKIFDMVKFIAVIALLQTSKRIPWFLRSLKIKISNNRVLNSFKIFSHFMNITSVIKIIFVLINNYPTLNAKLKWYKENTHFDDE